MLNGVDISSHNGDVNIPAMTDTDFVIVKLTEGLTYDNPYAYKAGEVLASGKLLGCYHYARNNDAENEARHFLDLFEQYKGKAIPVLDWEEDQGVEWVNRWVRFVHGTTGIWPWIYANPWRFNQGGVEVNCDRWIAAYPNEREAYYSTDPGNVPNTDGSVCAWQYSSNGRVTGYAGRIDINHYYGDSDSWQRYCDGDNIPVPIPSPDERPDSSTLENDDYKVTIERK